MKINLFAGALLNYLYNNLLTHIPIHFIRKFFLRLFNNKIHKSSVILMHTRLLNFWNLQIEERSVINQYCVLDCRRYKIVIDYDTDIGPYTRIWTLGHKPDSATHELYGGDVVIGHHVWIASGVTILPGIIIHKGAVVAAASVVIKNVGELEIVAGNPAEVIKKRSNSLMYQLSYKPIFE